MGKLHVRRSLQRLLACAVLLLAGSPAFAQFERSRVAGTVNDQQGGVVPGVTVTATNQATNQIEVVVTDESGFYIFPSLAPGQYTISAELQGFKKATRTGVQLDAAGSITMDLTLETGALSEEVTVTADAALLQTDVAMRKTVESKDIEQLALAGRNPIGVAGLKAGVAAAPSTTTVSTTSATAASTSTAAATMKTTSPSMAPRPFAPVPRATPSASRTSMPCRKCRC